MPLARRLRHWLCGARQRGLTTVEYAVAGGLIVAAAAGAFALLGTNVSTTLSSLATSILGN